MKFKELREKYRSKFPASLVAAAVKIAIDMGGNMTGAYKKIEKMKRGLGDDPMVKDALRMANESSIFLQNPRLPKGVTYELPEAVLNELNFSYAFFDKQSLNKFMLKALKIKGLEVVDSEKKQGGHYVVRVKSDDKKIIAKANSVAIRAMSEWVEEINPQQTVIEKVKPGKGKGKADVDYIGDSDLTKKLEKKFKVKIKSSGRTSADIIGNKADIVKLLQSDAYMMDDEDIEDLYPDLLEGVISEALSKKISDAEARKIQKKYNLAMDQFQDLKNDYSPKKTPRPKAWISLDYPVRDGDYYFAFVSNDEKKNTKFNSKLNDVLRNVGRGRIVGGINKATDLADEIWDAVSKEVKKYPKDLGWNDTMTREEIWASIGHMIAAPGFKEEIEEVFIDKMRIGKRKKAPKWS